MEFSTRERSIWIELFVSVSVAIYYFSGAYGAGGFTNLANGELGKIIVNAILISIAATITLTVVFNRNNPANKDERDISIEAKGNSYAYYALCVFCTIIIGHIMISEGLGYFSSDIITVVNAPFIMHLLLIAMIISGAIKSLTQIICYRRGF